MMDNECKYYTEMTEEALVYLFESLYNLHRKVDSLMAGEADIAAAVAVLQADTSAALQDIKDEVAALQAQLPDPAAAQSIIDSINALDAQVKGADPGAPAAPVAEPVATTTEMGGPVDGQGNPIPVPDPNAPVA